MTMYDDSRVVTLLREIDPPLSPPDRLIEVRRRARRGESRRATALASVMALVLAAGVVSVINLGGRGKTETLSVAGAANATTAAGSARVTVRAAVTKATQTAIPVGELMVLSGPVDFTHEKFVLKGTFNGVGGIEERGIGKDRWTKYDLSKSPGAGLMAGLLPNRKPWTHYTDNTAAGDLASIGNSDPTTLLTALKSKGDVLSTSQVGDRTRTVLRLPSEAFGMTFGSAPRSSTVDTTVDSDSDGRIRLVTTETTAEGLGTMRVSVAYDDFGVGVDVQPPPADQVDETPAVSSSGMSQQFSVGTSGSGTSSPADRKKACDMFKRVREQQPAPKTDQEKAQRAQIDQIIAQACAKS
ncbi:MAG: hypothetical protein QOI82_1184 [Actinomycetota bacterium]|jgi:hypothetical protein|nr:hypothetical protein [Actinomycetota bacterium]